MNNIRNPAGEVTTAGLRKQSMLSALDETEATTPSVKSQPDQHLLIRFSAEFALGFDRSQSLVMQRKKDSSKSIQSCRTVAFIASNKAVLRRVLASFGVTLSPQARAALDTLPDTFREWLSGREGAS